MNSEAQKKPVYISQIVIKILSYAVLICGCLMVLIPIVVILLGAFKTARSLPTQACLKCQSPLLLTISRLHSSRAR